MNTVATHSIKIINKYIDVWRINTSTRINQIKIDTHYYTFFLSLCSYIRYIIHIKCVRNTKSGIFTAYTRNILGD